MALKLPTSTVREIDLRTRRTEADRMRPATRGLYVALLAIAIAAGVTVLVANVVEMVVPRTYHVFLSGGTGDTLVVSDLDAHFDALTLGDRVLAIFGIPVEPGTGVEERALEALVDHPPGPLTLSVLDRDALGSVTLRDVTIEPTRSGLISGLSLAVSDVSFILIALIGLLALQARVHSRAVGVLVQLCIVSTVFVGPLEAWARWSHVLSPLPALARSPERTPAVLIYTGLVLVAATVLFGHLLLRLVYVFPTDDPIYRKKVPPAEPGPALGWFLRALLAASLVLTVLTLWPRAEGPPPGLRTWWSVPVGVLVVLGIFYLLPLILGMAVRVFRLARLRLADLAPGSEERQQALVALVGIRFGALLFLLAVLWLAVGSILGAAVGDLEEQVAGTSLDPVTLGVAWEGGFGMLASVASVAPFLGIGLAVVRRGLWDVDLAAQKAALYSSLGVGFILFWFLANETIEAIFSTGFAGVAPVVAAVAVAGLRSPVSGVINRLFPGSMDFGRAMERVSQSLGEVSDRALAQHLGETLALELAVDRVAVLQRDAGGALATAWSHGSEDLPDGLGAAAANALSGSGAADVIVRTDTGPLLAARVGSGAALAGLVVLGPRRDGRFFTSVDRRSLALILGPLASLFHRELRP